jgi:hypothetical protein
MKDVVGRRTVGGVRRQFDLPADTVRVRVRMRSFTSAGRARPSGIISAWRSPSSVSVESGAATEISINELTASAKRRM